jgi:Tol biopolymer transport system component/CubicO group peptidase (beta-lactamase class C family)
MERHQQTKTDFGARTMTWRRIVVFLLAVPLSVPAAASSTGARAEAVGRPDELVEAVVFTRLGPPDWDVFLFEAPGAAPRALTDDPALDYNAVFSPDGRWVVFTSERAGSADLYALDLERGSAPVPLTRDPAMDDAASFSPDGKRLAFVSSRDGYADVFVMPFSPGDATAESRAVNLTHRPGGDFNPAFSPDGRHIAFSRQTCLWAEGDICWEIELCVMDADGSNVRTLATARAGIPANVEYEEGVAGSPAWSPDGAAIYYYSVYSYATPSAEDAADETIEGGEIRRVSLDGSGDALVVPNGYSPAVAGDGRLAFVRPLEQDGPDTYYSGQVVSVAPDGSNLRAESPELNSWLDSCFAPDFDRSTGRMVCHRAAPGAADEPELPQGRSFVSPSGARRVELPDRTVMVQPTGAFFPALTAGGEVISTSRIRSAREASAGRGPKAAPLHVSAIDGTDLREVFAPPSGIAWGAAVARDAGWVVASVGPTFGASGENLDIWKVRLDGTEAVNLTPDSPANDAFPSISADARRIVFRSGRDGPRGETSDDPPADMAIYVMGGDGENPHRLTDSDARETMPAISPDGEWVVYVVRDARAAKLWLSRVDGSERRLLEPERAHIPDQSLHPRFSPDGRWVVFTSDRGGLNDEWPITPQPQPYGELWVVPRNGGQAIRLTSDKWEDGPNDWGSVRPVAAQVAESPLPEPAQRAADGPQPRPEDGWHLVAPEALGLERAPLEQMTEALRRDEYPNVHAVLIAKDGRLVYDEYFQGTDRRWGEHGKRHDVELRFDRDTPHDTRSVGKSIVSALVGMAIAAGKIESVDQPIFEFFPEHAALATPEKRQITLEHALTMSAGLDWNEGEVPYTSSENHEIQMDESTDPAGFVLARELESEPGTGWYYNSGLPVLLGLVTSRAAGKPLGAFAREHLFDPLGMKGVEWGGCCNWVGIPELEWESDRAWARTANPAGSLWIRPRDLLKFGALYLNGGRWNGRQLIPADWVERSLRAHLAKPGSLQEHGPGVTSVASYGYLWHHDRYDLPYGSLTVHAAYGNGGQRIWVIPELDLVAVHLTGNYNVWTSDWNAERLLLERIVPWAMNIETDYTHEQSRPVHRLEPGEWPRVDIDPARYAGVWEENGARIDIRVEAGDLLMMLPGTSGVNLLPETEHTFAMGRIEQGVPSKVFWPDARIVFVPDEGGAIVRYEGRAVGREEAIFVGVKQAGSVR